MSELTIAPVLYNAVQAIACHRFQHEASTPLPSVILLRPSTRPPSSLPFPIPQSGTTLTRDSSYIASVQPLCNIEGMSFIQLDYPTPPIRKPRLAKQTEPAINKRAHGSCSHNPRQIRAVAGLPRPYPDS
ncbi:hypothetical protein N656DRAFT_458934 [Canariomyces notabilis]|uniref:Uncharacterized protein n=1 Tax=Canariomyces notabilis TaxID=2074819 RepID=A0AAN6QD49_9PEZI|nr:hypothetical protein N656DRAFT_458934 [Canariomyces arenarius]